MAITVSTTPASAAATAAAAAAATSASASKKKKQQRQQQRTGDDNEDAQQPSGGDSHSHKNNKKKDLGPKDRQRMMVWPVMFAQYFGLGLMRPEMPGLLLELFDGSMENVALYQGATDAVGALVAFALVPLIGDFSDDKGRKPALLISAICAAAPVFVLALYGYVINAWATIVLYAAVALVSKLNSYSVALSYVADCSSIAQRSSVFGEVSGVMFIGLTAGPFVSGFLPRDASLVSAALLNVGAALYVAFIMPETLGRQQHLQEQREALAQGSGEEHAADPEKQKLIGSSGQKSYGADSDNLNHKDNKTAHVASAAEPKKKKKRGVWMAYHFLTQNRLFMLIGLITLVSQLAVFGVGQVYFLYLNEEAGFARADTIRAALIGGVETTFVMLFGMPWLSQHVNESVLMLIGLTCYFIYAMGLALAASSKLIVFGIIIFWSLSGLTFPSTCALLSAHTPHEQTGLAQGALSAMRCCASGLGPALFAVFFSKMVSLKREVMGPQPVHFVEDKATLSFFGLFDVHYAALPFVLGAVFIAASLALTLYIPSNIIHAPSTKLAQVEPEPDQHEHQHELLKEADEAEEDEGDEEWPARSKDKKEVVEV